MTNVSGRAPLGQALVSDQAALRRLDPPGFDPSRIGRWFSIAEDGPPMPEVFVLCWDGRTTFVDWCGSKVDFGRGVTHWLPYEMPPGETSDMHDGRRAFAASAIDARQSQDGETRLGPEGESATRRGTPE